MTHAEMDELYDLYALGVLEPELAAEIDEHLARQCAYCQEHIQEALHLNALLAGIAEPKQPAAALRHRILAAVSPVRQSRNLAPVVAGLAAACIALLALSLWFRGEIGGMRQQLTAVRSERDQLRAALEVMSRSETRSVQFGRADNVPHGRVFVNRRGGLVFVASQLPQIAANRTFELWLIPHTGAPRPAGLFRPNASGNSVEVSSIAVDPSQTKAVAVSIEPAEGSSAPTTTPILVVPLG